MNINKYYYNYYHYYSNNSYALSPSAIKTIASNPATSYITPSIMITTKVIYYLNNNNQNIKTTTTTTTFCSNLSQSQVHFSIRQSRESQDSTPALDRFDYLRGVVASQRKSHYYYYYHYYYYNYHYY